MARRRKITIDGGNPIETAEDTTIHEAIQAAGIEATPPSIVSVADGEIITASDFGRPAPLHGMLVNQTDLVKGGSLRDRLLDRESHKLLQVNLVSPPCPFIVNIGKPFNLRGHFSQFVKLRLG